MRNQRNEQKKLSFKKFQIAKIKNPQFIVGGDGDGDDDNSIRTDETMKGNGLQ